MVVARICLEDGCPRITTNGSRCPEHQRARTAAIEQRRGTRYERGYTDEWVRLSQELIRAQPWCSQCGTARSGENPLTADHIVPLARGGTSTFDNLQVLCRRCNSAKGSRVA